jgi:hypothetical protein
MARKKDPNRVKKQPKGDYSHGYAKIDPKYHWKPDQSGNPGGKRGERKVLDEDDVFLEEMGRRLKVKFGDDLASLEKLRISYRQLADAASKGELSAIREVNRKIERIFTRRLARERTTQAPTAEPPLTPEELGAFALALKREKDREGAGG